MKLTDLNMTGKDVVYINCTNYLDTLFGRPDVDNFDPMGDLDLRRNYTKKISYDNYVKYIGLSCNKTPVQFLTDHFKQGLSKTKNVDFDI